MNDIQLIFFFKMLTGFYENVGSALLLFRFFGKVCTSDESLQTASGLMGQRDKNVHNDPRNVSNSQCHGLRQRCSGVVIDISHNSGIGDIPEGRRGKHKAEVLKGILYS